MTKKTTQMSRMVDLQDVRDHKTVTLDVRANKEECEALAQRFNILEVVDLNAYVTISSGGKADLFKVEGDLSAHVVQECCVTLSPVPERVEDSFSEVLTTSEALLKPADEMDEDPNQPVDLIRGDRLELGEIIAQWLALALNPYPRSETPTFLHIEQAAQVLETQTPFQVLAGMRDK